MSGARLNCLLAGPVSNGLLFVLPYHHFILYTPSRCCTKLQFEEIQGVLHGVTLRRILTVRGHSGTI